MKFFHRTTHDWEREKKGKKQVKALANMWNVVERIKNFWTRHKIALSYHSWWLSPSQDSSCSAKEEKE